MCDLPPPAHVLQVLQAGEPPRGRGKSGIPRGNVSFWHSSGDTADNNIDQASRTSGLTRTPSLAWLCVRACVRFGCGATVALRCMPSTCAGCHVFRGAAGKLTNVARLQ